MVPLTFKGATVESATSLPSSGSAQSSGTKQDIPAHDNLEDQSSSTLSQSWTFLSDRVGAEETNDTKTTRAADTGQVEEVMTLDNVVPPATSDSDLRQPSSDDQCCHNPTCSSWASAQKRRLNEISRIIQEELDSAGPLHSTDRNQLIDQIIKQIPLAADRWLIWGKRFEESILAGNGLETNVPSANDQRIRKQHYDARKAKIPLPLRDAHAARRESIIRQKQDERRRSEPYGKHTNALHHGVNNKATSSRVEVPASPQLRRTSNGQDDTASSPNRHSQPQAPTNTFPPHVTRMDFAVPDGWELRVSYINGYPYWIATGGGFSPTPPAGLEFHRQRCQIELPYGWEMYRRRMNGHAETPVFVNHQSMIMQYQWPGLVRPLESMVQQIDRTLPPVVLLVEEGGGVRRAT